jgi:tetratricopeptide (TPR) repeat protein
VAPRAASPSDVGNQKLRQDEVGTEQTLFISRAGVDADFAAEIARVLEGAGYAVILQQWDFANRNFIERMHEALAGGARVVALLSPEYLRTDYCAAEWQNAIAGDPLNKQSRLVLLRVAECEPPGLLAGMAYWDLVAIRDNRPLLADIVRNAVGEQHRDAASGPYWREPRSILDAEAIRATPSFTGREAELEALAAGLADGDATAVVHGLGGTGKSSLAREYAWRNRDRYAVAWWLNAQTEDGIVDGLLRLGALFVRGLDDLADRRAAAQQVTSTVLAGFTKPVLVVFDNLEDERLLRRWRPRTGCHVLATSRDAAWSGDVVTVALQTWPPDDAVRYLRRESGRTDMDETNARVLAEALGGLPLALAHAAAYLRGTRTVTPRRYLERVVERMAFAPRNAEYPRSVFATFQTAIAEAERQAPGSAATLCFASWFAPSAIPEELFRQSCEACAGLRPALPDGPVALELVEVLGDDTLTDEALGALDRLSLVAFAETDRSYNVHRLVQLAARDLVRDAALAWNRCAIAAAAAAFGSVEFDAWPQCERVLPHARAALDQLPSDAMFLPAGLLANRCGTYLRMRAAYAEAEPLLRRALAICEASAECEPRDVALTRIGLANVLKEEGRYDEAEPLFTTALASLEAALGPEHPDLAIGLNNLANLCADLRRYAEAGALYARSLSVLEKAFGSEHPRVAIALNNWALLDVEQRHYDEAEPRYLRALSIWEKAFGPDHPDVATSVHNLAELRVKQGRYAEAEPLYARSLALRERTLGPEHPEVAESLANLALLDIEQGRYDAAEPRYTRALAIFEKALGADHPTIAENLNALADAHAKHGRLANAEPLLVRALAIRDRALGSAHELTQATCEQLAELAARRSADDCRNRRCRSPGAPAPNAAETTHDMDTAAESPADQFARN